MKTEKKSHRKNLIVKLISSLLIQGLIMTAVISFFSYYTSKSRLEDMYADKVINGSTSIANMIDSDDVKTIIGEGGADTDTYKRLYDSLCQIKKDGNITFLSLTVPTADTVTFYIDAYSVDMGDDPVNFLPYGTPIPYKDAATVDGVFLDAEYQKYIDNWNIFQDKNHTETPIITDNEYGYNYTGVATIVDETGNPVAQIQYILDMQSVRDQLNNFLITMIIICLIIITIAQVAYLFFARHTVTTPLEKLSTFTKGITSNGNFSDERITTVKTGDEIEELADSFNYMLDELKLYIENLSKITAEKERIGAELDVAKNIQASMLPCIFPAFPDRNEFDIYATMNPAKEVGGDFYDFFMLDDKHLAIVMADVSGKGVPAALFMVIGKTLIKDHSQLNRDLGEVFSEVNNLLCEANSEGLFITAFEGILNIETGDFRFVNAGHEMPFIYKKSEGYKPYKIRAGFVLAGMEDMMFKGGEFKIEPGDKIFQYTDGVTEATDINNQLYGMERLENILNKCADYSPKETLIEIKKDIDEFVGEAPQFDDITMLSLEYKGKQS